MDHCPYCASPVQAAAPRCLQCGASLDSDLTNPQRPTLPIGTHLQSERYSLGKVLGQGGFGITYLGADTRMNQPVAIKELFPEGSLRQGGGLVSSVRPEDKQRFVEEARTLAQFRHPSIVRVLDVFEENATAYLVMELLQGQTLGKRIETEGRLGPQEVLDVAMKLLDGLEEVHRAGLLHRDIKPDNIFLTRNEQVVLIDFGSARHFAQEKTVSHTRLVTPGYAPLEQYGSAGKFGPYTDLYALGATLYHALSGDAPPAATDRVQGNMPLQPIPGLLGSAIEKALEIRIDLRPQTAAEFRAMLLGQGGVLPSNPADDLIMQVLSEAEQMLNSLTPPSILRGDLILRVRPSRTRVHIQGPDGFFRWSVGNQDLTGLEPGKYNLDAQAKGFQSEHIWVTVKPGGHHPINITLLPEPQPARARTSLIRLGISVLLGLLLAYLFRQ